MSDKQVVLSRYHVEDEGNSIAGWIGVTIMVLGFIVGTVGMFINADIVTYVGAGIVIVGAIAWPILKLAGLGPKGHGH